MDMADVFYDKEICSLEYCEDKLLHTYEANVKFEMSNKRKLRLYRNIKKDCNVEKYVKLNLTQSQRSLLCQLRIGVLPLRVETGRYINLKVEDRICEQCNLNSVEDELHFLFHCTLYEEERVNFYSNIDNRAFIHMADIDKLEYLCNEKPRLLAKYIVNNFEKRKSHQYR